MPEQLITTPAPQEPTPAPDVEPFRAHQLDANGVIVNTVVVKSLDVLPNLVDAAIGGYIGDSIIDGVLVPVPVDPVPVVVPDRVTMRQARLALLEAGLLGTVDAAIASMTGVEGQAARIEWDYSQEVWRNKGLVSTMAQALGLTNEQLDAMFLRAGAL